MGFLQKLQTIKNEDLFCEIRNINFITFNREKTGSFIHVSFDPHSIQMINCKLLPEALCNLYRGLFVKVVCTKKNDKEDNSAFYKFHAWLNTSNIISMKLNEVFQNYSDIKFADGSSVITCSSHVEIIRCISQLKKEKKNNGKE